MKVGIYGCSFSYGARSNNYISWVNSFAKLRPDLELYNYANAGSSLMYSIEVFEDTKHLYDKTIFQITLPGRLTYYYKDNIRWHELLEPHPDGYMYLPHSVADKHMACLHPAEDIDRKFIEDYYTRRSIHTVNLEHNALAEYAHKHSSFAFAQFHGDNYTEQRYTVLQDLISVDQLQSYKSDFIDEPDLPGHFNKQGCNWQANWINNSIDF